MKVRTFWCRTCVTRAGVNFGDALGPRLLETVGIEAEWCAPDRAQLVTAGSVLSKIKPGWRGAVWGTGLIKDTAVSLTKANVISVRGELTRDRAGLPKGTSLGDPGVLAPVLFGESRVISSYAELVVPHYVDHDMVVRHPRAKFADVTGDPEELLLAIASAGVVYTSSLHALIAADALGVAHVYEPHPSVIGGEWKFNDYLSALGEPGIRPGVDRLTPRVTMLAKQCEVRDQLSRLPSLWT